jgi:hypothetical protein
MWKRAFGKESEMAPDWQPSADGKGKYIELYNLYRDYLKHEDGLINWRTSWFLVVQAVVLGAYATLRIKSNLLYHTILALASVGFFSCALHVISILAAVLAIRALRAKWEMLIHVLDEDAKLLPGITSGGRRTRNTGGHLLAVMLPAIFGSLWLFVAASGYLQWDRQNEQSECTMQMGAGK